MTLQEKYDALLEITRRNSMPSKTTRDLEWMVSIERNGYAQIAMDCRNILNSIGEKYE